MNLAKRREERNMTRYRLAKAAGLSQPYIQAIESGEKSPTLRTLEKLAKGLGITVAELISEDEPDQKGA